MLFCVLPLQDGDSRATKTLALRVSELEETRRLLREREKNTHNNSQRARVIEILILRFCFRAKRKLFFHNNIVSCSLGHALSAVRIRSEVDGENCSGCHV